MKLLVQFECCGEYAVLYKGPLFGVPVGMKLAERLDELDLNHVCKEGARELHPR